MYNCFNMRLLNTYFRKSLRGLSCGVLSLFSVVSVSAQTTTDTYTTAGSHTWTVPQGVTSVTIEAWGAGGGGGGTLSHILPYSNPRAGGGGGGAYSQTLFNVSPGDVFTIEVGTGGTGGAGDNDGSAGSMSSIEVSGAIIISAEGGQGGSFRTSNDVVGTATGLGGSTGVGFTFAGGNGGPNNNDSNGSGGGGAGGSTENGTDGTVTSGGNGGVAGGGNGGAPVTTNDADGNPGFAPGGGGGGSRRTLLEGSSQGGNGAHGEIRITYCKAPDQPDFITGESNLCEATVQNYSVTLDPEADSYVWTLPSGWSGTSSTNTIGVMTGESSGVITVEAINQCGTSEPQTLTISTTPLPAQPSVISGNATACTGTTETYSVSNDPTVDSYSWTLPSDWTGTSTTHSIDAIIASGGGAISVYAQNACGTSPVRILNVSSAGVPAQPSVISGDVTVCQGATATYSVVNNPAVTGYTWSIPNDWTGTSATHTISVTAGAISGEIMVVAENSCGSSIPQRVNVTANPINGEITQSGITLTATQAGAVYQWVDCSTGAPIAGATSQSFTPTQNGEYGALIFTSDNCSSVSNCILVNNLGLGKEYFDLIAVYPNPASETVMINNIPAESTVRLLDMTGKVIYSTKAALSLTINLTDVKAGVYMLNVENTAGSSTQKLVVKK